MNADLGERVASAEGVSSLMATCSIFLFLAVLAVHAPGPRGHVSVADACYEYIWITGY